MSGEELIVCTKPTGFSDQIILEVCVLGVAGEEFNMYVVC
jgi:hypothetical protein